MLLNGVGEVRGNDMTCHGIRTWEIVNIYHETCEILFKMSEN